jgi:non-ribosomal peptide synthetase component F
VLSPALTTGLKEVSEQQQLTLYMTLLAAWAALLARYSGQSDVVVGSPIANRQDAQLEDLIGFFVNTLVLRVRVEPKLRFRELLAQVRRTALEAYQYQDVPFERLVEQLQPERSLSTSPIFQVMFTLHNGPRILPAFADLKVEGVQSETLHVRTDVDLNVWERHGQLATVWFYNRDLFDATRVAQMARHYERTLEAVAADPERRIDDIGLLDHTERRQLLHTWNATRQPVQESTVTALLEAQAARTPERVAVVYAGQHLTYAALNARANRLAHRLMSEGTGPEARVGIAVARSLDLVVAFVAVLKAGGAYVPLDAAYPGERLAFMTADAALTLLLTDATTRDRVATILPPSTLLMGVDDEELPVGDTTAIAPAPVVNPANAAYIIYTSGSTGRPKGTMVTHANLVNFFAAMDRQLGSEVPQRWVATTSISFDISVLELLWTLTRGACVVVADELAAVDLRPGGTALKVGRKTVDFSLFYFAADDGAKPQKYELLLEGAKFADRHGFAAVWTPERHFHPFGGLYPNPSVTSAAIAAVTQRINIRAGSVVLPLHNPLRVVEEWSVVDNLSNGRVGLSFAPGWQANDFVLAPDRYSDRKQIMVDHIETIRGLWRGDSLALTDGLGKLAQVRIYPRPIQSELPFWLTAAGNPETFRLAA